MIHARASSASLGLLRLYVFSIWAVILLVEWLPTLAYLPRSAFVPRGALAIIPAAGWDLVLSRSGLTLLVSVMAAGAIVVASGLLPSRALALAVAGLLLFEQGLVRGFGGHVNHAELVLLYGTLLLPFFPIFDGLTLRRPRNAGTARLVLYQAPFVLFVTIFVVSFSLTGIARLVKGPSLFAADALRNLTLRDWTESGSIVGSMYAFPAVPWFLSTQLAPMFRLSYISATIAEVLSPVALFYRPLRIAFVAFAIAFHAANLLLLGVTFYENILLLVIFSDRWFHKLADRLAMGRSGRVASGLTA